MTEPQRLRASGRAADRALLANAEVPAISDQLRRQVRHGLEERLSPRGRRRAAGRLLLALAGTLAAGGALAFTITPARGPGSPPVPAHAITIRPGWTPTETPHPAARAPAPVSPARRSPAHTSAAPEPPLHPFGEPTLRSPFAFVPEPEPEPALEPTPAPPPPRLSIAQPGRPATALVLAADRIAGRVRGREVALTLGPAHIDGHIGDHHVSLWLHGREAEGTIGGLPARFELGDTRDGVVLRAGFRPRGGLPIASTRIAATAGSLAWFPGCGSALPLTAPGAYQGRCGGAGPARIEIPAGWNRLPLLTRLVLLSLALP